MAVVPVRDGDVVAGKYVVERMIGEGGMGVVVAASHRDLGQRVAIKFLSGEIAEQPTSAERFRREARAAARIRSEHVCRVLDVGTLENGVPFMVMEYLEGCDLATELEQRQRIPASEAVDYVLQACEALAEAHVAGIVHRDLKPANLYLSTRADGSRCVKVLDFGVSKSSLEAAGGGLALTKTASLIGSPLYMSPEQLDAAKDVDARSDVWALGTVLYELITGRTPFLGESIAQLVNQVLHGRPPTFQELGVTAPHGLEEAMLRALQKLRAERYPSVGEFSRALAPHASGQANVSAARVARVLSSSEAERARASAQVPEGAPTRRESQEVERTLQAAATPSAAGHHATQASWGNTEGGARPARRWGILAAAAVPFVVVGGFLAWRSSASADRVPAGPESSGGTPAAIAAPPAAPASVSPPAAPVPLAGDVPGPAITPSPVSPGAAPSTAAVPAGAPLEAAARAPKPRPAAPLPPKNRASEPAVQPSAAPQRGISNFGGRR